MSSHKHSRLLTQEENDLVFELFPKRCLVSIQLEEYIFFKLNN